MTATTSLAQLQSHFNSNHWPLIEAVDLAATSGDQPQVQLALSIGADIHWLKGHFPQQPVLAGVVQTHWAGELAKAIFALEGDLVRIDNLKFQQVILPGQALSLSLELAFSQGFTSVKFRYFSAQQLFSEGKLVFQSPQMSDRP